MAWLAKARLLTDLDLWTINSAVLHNALFAAAVW
jgi:hypothetical protein